MSGATAEPGPAPGAGAALDRLDKDVVHEICTNQVVVTLHACIKELVENALDAGASRIEIRLRESGSELLEVVDNGHGIAPGNFNDLAARHATSKIRDYEELSQALSTFGFRGEALSAIAAMGDMTVCTRTTQEKTAALLAYDRFGKLTSHVPAARDIGTTVSVRDLFRRIPVRHREFLRGAKAQVHASLRLLQAYAIARPEVHFHIIAEKARGPGAGRATLLSTSGAGGDWRQAAAAVLGDLATQAVERFELRSEQAGWDVMGLISSPQGGRRARDSQFYFVNQRPVDPPKRIAKLINDTYHQYNSRMWPVVILSFTAAQGLVDVNVTPDKRTVLLRNEEQLLGEIQQVLTGLFNQKSASSGSASLSDFGVTRTPTRPAQTQDQEPAQSLDPGPVSSLGSAVGGSLAPARTPGQAPPLQLETPEKPGKPSCLQGSAGPELMSGGVSEAEGGSEREVLDRAASPLASQEDAQRSRSSWPWTHSLQGRSQEEPSQGHIIELDPASLVPESEDVRAEDARDALVIAEEFYPAPVPAATEPVLAGAGEHGQVTAEDELIIAEEFHPTPLPAAPEPAHASTADTGLVIAEEYHPPPVPVRAAMDLEDMPTGMDDFVVAEEFRPASLPPDAPQAHAQSDFSSPQLLPPMPTESRQDAPAPLQPGNTEPIPLAAPVPADAIGGSISTGISLADLGAAVARQRQRRSQSSNLRPQAPSARCHFPSAFSLSSLRAGEQGRASLEEVARFQTDSAGSEETARRITFDKNCFSEMRVIGQFNLGFIIAALRTGPGTSGLQLFIVDQHASDEKFRFEGLNRESRIDKQPLMTPHHLQLTPAQEQLAETHREIFRLNGFDLQSDAARPPGRRLRLATVPTCQGLVFGERDVHDLLYTLEEAEAEEGQQGPPPSVPSVPSLPSAAADAESAPALTPAASQGLLDLAGHRGLWSSSALPRPAKVWQLLACRACRGAIMIGKALRKTDMERILRNLGTLDQPWNCPHGRPTMRHLIDTAASRRAAEVLPPLCKLRLLSPVPQGAASSQHQPLRG